MSWNYRVVKYADDGGFGLHQVFYDKSGNIEGWTEEAIMTCAANESFEREFIKELKAMMADIERGPTLNETDLPDTSA